MRILAAFACIVSACMLFPGAASADHDQRLEEAAKIYRETVREFEKDVIRARYFHRDDVRLVDDLEDATSGLRSAARHPERLDRLIQRWNEVACLQGHVETVIFNHARYPHHPLLEQRWHTVVHAGRIFSQQLSLLQIPYYPPPAPVIRQPRPEVQYFAPPPSAPTYHTPIPLSPIRIDPFRFEQVQPQQSFGYPADTPYRGRAITIPSSPATPSYHRVHAVRRDIGGVQVGARLMRSHD